MKYIELTFKLNDTAKQEMLLALLANAGYEGFEETNDELKAFIKENEFNKTELDAVCAGIGASFTVTVIEQQNWNAQWESSFEPVLIPGFAAVRAGFHAPVKEVQHEIIITPKMSFGTGHHATTYLMMQQMSELDIAGKSVFDFGTGTGVLAILAEKMGATTVYAIDNDDWSIENTRENIAANGCSCITVEKADTIDTNRQYQLILANINLNVLLATMSAVASICLPGATVLFSGILVNDEPALKAAASANGLVFCSVSEKNGWLCIKAVYR
jgi:ribosomal protein L11 methyltransferase